MTMYTWRTLERFIPRMQLLLAVLVGASSVTALAAPPAAYVITGGTVSVIDTTTEAVVGVITTGSTPTRIASAADGARAFISSSTAGTVTVVDTSTHSITATFHVGAGAGAMTVSPDGARLYIVVGSALQVLDAVTGSALAVIPLPSGAGGVAITPDGSRVYVNAGGIQVIDTTTNTIVASPAGLPYPAGALVLSPQQERLYYTTNGDLFGAGASVVVLDTATNTLVTQIWIGSILGQLAITPDGSRVYLGLSAHWVDTGYGAGFFNDRIVAVIDTSINAWVQSIDLGASGSAWNQQNTPSGIAVAPNRSDVYIAVPRVSSVAVVPVNTNVVAQWIAVSPSPSVVNIPPDPDASIIPYVVNAVDDAAAFPIPTSGATAVANVLVNDRLGGIPARFDNVILTQESSTTAGLALNVETGAVTVGATAALGPQQLVYQICETASPTNCDQATVSVTVRVPYVIDAVDDSATTKPGTQPLNVLPNDTLNGVAATTSTVTLSVVSSTSPWIQLHTGTGQIYVYVQTTGGNHTLVYRICEKQVPANCDTANVNLTVVPLVVDAVNDAGTATRSGGVAVSNVLLNDTIDGVAATTSRVTLSQLTAAPGLSLNLTTGAVSVASGTALGTHTLSYRICETVVPSNCDDATVTVTVTPYVIDAVNDYGKGASKYANTVIPSVLTNDRLGGGTVSASNVILSHISLTPANSKIQLNLTTGAVTVTGKTDSGIYALVYQICERANPTNCDRATATIELSGGL